jgi:Pyridoxamine 5'-phosphate oxidase
MADWSDVARQAGELADQVQQRFDAFGLGLLATLRRDGSPRISGIEPLFANGQLWFGMMTDSLKARDLKRDARFELHSATTDKQVAAGDAKVSGTAIEVTDAESFATHRDAFAAQTGYPPPEGPFHLFKADIREIFLLKPAASGDHLKLDYWIEGQGLKHVDRY